VKNIASECIARYVTKTDGFFCVTSFYSGARVCYARGVARRVLH